MIKVNDRFSFERDKYQWLLHESRLGKDKKGNDKVHVDTSYHGSLRQICEQIIDRQQGSDEFQSLNELLIFTESTIDSMMDHAEFMLNHDGD